MQIITVEERSHLEKRLEEMKAKRPVISKRIAEARALGDLSENAEYHAAREDQGLNEAEIRRLEERLRTVKVVDKDDAAELAGDMAFLGSVVLLKDLGDESEDLYKIVGEATGRFDGEEIEVTAASPMGEALMKARVGDVVKVDLPRGSKRFEVREIR